MSDATVGAAKTAQPLCVARESYRSTSIPPGAVAATDRAVCTAAHSIIERCKEAENSEPACASLLSASERTPNGASETHAPIVHVPRRFNDMPAGMPSADWERATALERSQRRASYTQQAYNGMCALLYVQLRCPEDGLGLFKTWVLQQSVANCSLRTYSFNYMCLALAPKHYIESCPDSDQIACRCTWSPTEQRIN